MLSSSNSKTTLAFMSFLPDLGLPNTGELFPDAWEFETMDIGTQFDAVEMGKKTECMLYGKRFDHTCITCITVHGKTACLDTYHYHDHHCLPYLTVAVDSSSW